MATDKQKQTARENGKQSHGPTSTEGKAVSSRNAVSHGFRSTRWLVRNDEDRAQLDALLDAFTAEYQPSGPTETALVRDLAHSRYSLERIWAMQIAGLDCEVDHQRPRLERNFGQLDEPTCLYLAFDALAKESPGLALLNRYQVSYDRAFHRARKALLETQAARREREAENRADEVALPEEVAPQSAPPSSGSLDERIEDFQTNRPSHNSFDPFTLPAQPGPTSHPLPLPEEPQ